MRIVSKNKTETKKKINKIFPITNAVKYRDFKAVLCIIFSALENLVRH